MEETHLLVRSVGIDALGVHHERLHVALLAAVLKQGRLQVKDMSFGYVSVGFISNVSTCPFFPRF